MPKRQLFESVMWDTYVREERIKKQQLTTNTLKNKGKIGAWRRWRRGPAIEDALPVVQRLARDVRRMFAAHIDVRDLQQAGAVGLVQAANAYDPALGSFAAYAYFRVRGSIIDSQKRRAYREESYVSLDALRDPRDGWLPAELHTDTAPRPDDIAGRALVRRRLDRVIQTLPQAERYVMLAFLDGRALRETAAACDRSPTWVREKLASAREMIRRGVR